MKSELQNLLGSSERIKVLEVLLNAYKKCTMTTDIVATNANVSRSTAVRHLKALCKNGIMCAMKSKPVTYEFTKKNNVVKTLIKLKTLLQ